MKTQQYFLKAALIAAGISSGPVLAQNMSLACTNAGNTYQVGDFACIAACHGARQLARCDQVAESAIWTYVSDVCPSAHFVPPPPNDASQVPVKTAMTPLPGPLKISTPTPEIMLKLAVVRIGTAPVR